MGKPKKLSRDELLAKKRAAEKARRDKIKMNPEAHAHYKNKERQRYKKRKEDKKVVPINDLTPRQQRNQRRKWKINSKNFRAKQKQKTLLQKKLAESTPPDSDFDDEAQPQNILPAQPSPSPSQQSSDDLQPENILPVQPSLNPAQSSNTPSSPAQSSLAASPSVVQNRVLTRRQLPNISQSSNSPSNPAQSSLLESPSVIQNRQLIRRQRYNMSKKIKFYKQQLNNVKKQNDMLRKRLIRSNIKLKKQYAKSPRTKADNLISDPNKKDEVKKALVFAEVMKSNLESNYEKLKTNVDKKVFKENIEPACKTLKNYKMLTKSIQPKLARKVNLSRKLNETKYKVQEDIKVFFESDDNTRMAAGKKECITRKKEKKQKRYLQDTLKNLHKKFLKTHEYSVSYSLFCQNKPFWVVTPTDKDMETCMCKLHENMTLLAQALWKNKIIQEKSSSEVLSATVCSIHDLACLERRCPSCINKVPKIMEFDNSVEIQYLMWQSGLKEVKTKTGNKTIKITEKKQHKGSPKTVIEIMMKDLQKFYVHCANIANQYECTTTLKNQLMSNEAVIHMDFSENYSTKHNIEVQAMHFGGSRNQISLHTSVVYIPGTAPKSFCTYSDCLRHDALGVWGHLVPILKYIENTAPNTDTLHIITDSTCSQYRNKTINFMITKLHWYLKNLVCITWNYTEAGHGKGAPDGVGATLKRTADQIVRYGRDIPDVDTFAAEMKKAIKNVVLEYVSEYDIYEKEYFLPSVLLRPFKGMMQVHQIVWNKDSENSIVLRRQSCISENCRKKAVSCFHGKHLGFYNLPLLDNSERTERSVIITSNIVIVPANNALPLNPDSTLNKDCSELFIEDIEISAPGSLFDPPHMQLDSISEVCTESFLQDVVPNPPASWNNIDQIMTYEGENNVPKSLSVLATAACNISLKLDLKTTEICPKTLMQDVESNSSVANNVLQLTDNQDCELLTEDSSGNIKSLENQPLVDIYSIDDHVLVRYYQRRRWTYYVGTVKAIKLQNNEMEFSIIFFKTIKKPSLKFVTTKRVDRDEVPQISIIKKLELKVNSENPKELFLCNDEDKVFFL